MPSDDSLPPGAASERGPSPAGNAGPELLTFGEAMLRYSPPSGQRLESADRFDVHVGGAESNVAAVASRLGTWSAWASKLPDSPLGRRVVDDLRRHGVAPLVAWSETGRVGTYYAEVGGEPRGTEVVYDRGETAVRTATAADLGVERVADATVVHTSGITPALSDDLAASTERVLSAAAAADATVSFDVNYRSKLWSPSEARETVTDLLGLVDVLTLARRDAETVLGRTGDPGDVAADLASEYDVKTVLVTLSDEGALAYHEGTVHEQAAFPADVTDEIGTGDAFLGGFLASRLAGHGIERALERGTAAAALKCTVAGDVAVIRPSEVSAVVEANAGGITR